MTQVLHISADYPDPMVPGKTHAISGLIELAGGIRHSVYSLNRISPRHSTAALDFGDGHRAIAYAAPPLGIAHRTCLDRLAHWIAADLSERGISPQAIHAHKLTVEGIVGLRLARQLNLPLIITCQGNTDLKILRARPDLKALFRDIWMAAAGVLAFAPWTIDALNARLGRRDGPTLCVPCPTEADALLRPKMSEPVIRSVFGLGAFANKNANLVVRAAVEAAKTIPGLKLEIVGAGPPSSVSTLAKMLQPFSPVARLAGPVPNGGVQALLNGSACLIVPSARESYGMVFAEALLAGCPVIHGQGNGISGYFPGAAFARPVSSDGVPGLARQIGDMLGDQARIKAELAIAQENGSLNPMRRPVIRDRYLELLRAAAGVVPGVGRSLDPIVSSANPPTRPPSPEPERLRA